MSQATDASAERVRESVDQVLDAIRADTSGLPSALPAALGDVVAAAAAGDLDAAQDATERHIAALKRDLAVARTLRAALKSLASAAPAPAPREAELDAIRAETDPARQRGRWALSYARALAHADFELCGALAAEAFAFRSALPILDRLIGEETEALLAGRPEEARGLLRFLAGTLAAGEPSEKEERHTLAAVLVVLARLELQEYGDPDAERRAKLLFNRARAIAPDSGLPEAARALRFERRAEYGSAMTRAQRAVRLSPERPEGYLALALCAEAQLAPHAAGYYAQVVERVLHADGDPRPGLALFAGEIPHTLLVMLARHASELGRHELALDLIEQALAPWASDEEREVQWRREAGEHKLHAEVLHALGRDALAAEALCDAIDRLNWAGETEQAVALAREATERDPHLGRARWLLADALRVAATLTEPPYVDRARLDDGIAAWESAEGDPADVPEWALWVRASIEDGRSRLPGEDRAERLWQAVTLSERGLLLEGSSAPTYAALAGLLRQLNRWPAALQASEQALLHDEGNALALEERLTLLANTGRYEEAEEVVDRLPPSPWLDSVRAFLLSRTGAPEQALELLQHAVAKTERPSVWQQELVAYCLRELGRREEAEREWEAIWSQRHDPAPDDRLGYAWAGWSLGNAPETLAMAEPLCDDPIDRAEALRITGLCELVLGRPEAAATHLRDGIGRSTGMRTLGEFIEHDLADAEARAEGVGDAVCAKAREWAQARIEELERHAGASQDLTEALADATPETGWAWVGALAGLARVAATEGNHREAAERYARLADTEHARFPGAARGHVAAIDALRYAGDARLLAGDAAGAAQEYAAALDAPGPLADEARFALRCRASAALLEAGDRAGAEARFAEALGDGDGAAIADAVEPVVRDSAHRWTLADGWGIQPRASGCWTASRRRSAGTRHRPWERRCCRCTCRCRRMSSSRPARTRSAGCSTSRQCGRRARPASARRRRRSRSGGSAPAATACSCTRRWRPPGGSIPAASSARAACSRRRTRTI